MCPTCTYEYEYYKKLIKQIWNHLQFTLTLVSKILVLDDFHKFHLFVRIVWKSTLCFMFEFIRANTKNNEDFKDFSWNTKQFFFCVVAQVFKEFNHYWMGKFLTAKGRVLLWSRPDGNKSFDMMMMRGSHSHLISHNHYVSVVKSALTIHKKIINGCHKIFNYFVDGVRSRFSFFTSIWWSDDDDTLIDSSI